MKIFFEIEEIDKNIEPTSVALGTFDGIHIGHMEVINIMKASALENKVKSLVYTFSNHPKEILTPNHAPTKIMDIDEKVQILTRLDLDYLALVKFDEIHKTMLPEAFIEDILIKTLNMKHLTVGYDFRFGANGSGDIKMLLEKAGEFGYTCNVIEPIMKNSTRVSSSLIRELLIEGKIEEANYFLGRTHFIKGVVVKGKGKGTDLGVPTANLRIKDNISAIKPGVYITETLWKAKFYNSITNVGYNPTFDEVGIHMETYIAGINHPMYDEVIEVHFLQRLRDELKFNSEKELIQAMKSDIQEMERYFTK